MHPTRPSRWCPTPEHVMILEEMYRGGLRNPKSTQIQAITSHLSHYGKIEGKNVFYWFQNHKARDKQKLRKKLTMLSKHKPSQQNMPYHHHFDQSQLFYYVPFQILNQGGIVNVSPQVVTCSGKGDFHQMDKVATKTDGSDWIVMLDVEPTNKPLKTLELFPTTATGYGLQNECTASIQIISSSSSTQ